MWKRLLFLGAICVNSSYFFVNAQTEDTNLSANQLIQKAYLLYDSLPGLAFRYAKEALVIAETPELKAEAHQLLGNSFYDQGTFQQSLNHYLSALTHFRDLGNTEANIHILNELGKVYYYIGQMQKALEMYQEALALNESLNKPKTKAETLAGFGFIYEKTENYPKALEYQQQALALYEQTNDQFGMATVYDNIASIYEDLDEYEKAYRYFKLAYQTNKAINNLASLAMNLNDLGDTFRKRGLYDSALYYTRQANITATKYNQKYQVRAAINDIGETFALMEQYDSAYEYMFNAQEAHKELYDEAVAKQIAQMQTIYEMDRKNREILSQKVEIQQQRSTKYLLLGVVAAVLLGLAIVYRNNRIKQRINRTLNEKNQRIERQKQHITDSITCAQTIQGAVLPHPKRFTNFANDFFLIYRPKDIVSGDFYWYGEYDDVYFAAVVDCTGHGVPGAFMSMIANTLLNELIEIRGITNPKEVLDKLDKKVFKALQQEETDNQDGMDITLCRFEKNPENPELFNVAFASAHQNVCIWKANKNTIERIRGTRRSIGGISREISTKRPFEEHHALLEPGDRLYLFTDGYADQNNANRDRIGNTNLIELLATHANATMGEQKKELVQFLEKHMGEQPQRDDITILGLAF